MLENQLSVDFPEMLCKLPMQIIRCMFLSRIQIISFEGRPEMAQSFDVHFKIKFERECPLSFINAVQLNAISQTGKN